MRQLVTFSAAREQTGKCRCLACFLHFTESNTALSCVAGAQGELTLRPVTRDFWDSVSLLVLVVDENRTFLGGNWEGYMGGNWEETVYTQRVSSPLHGRYTHCVDTKTVELSQLTGPFRGCVVV